ncbi:glycoside hydrolase [Trametes versicolor FP-101664 SS1]|uniref:glycoside hydrolase n=1 Tax=Trametes versicolor (strain FP-101664) TaxID=717944 RepID=UPI0004623B27|nr:glycoside hydrolase [Trametes versicolor FP-101664 SS1]EIW63844.1 glycoside hydrolase [Trametes versicolor FP-101664 SS1]
MLAFSILVAALWPALAAADVQSLSGLSWTLKNTNGSIVVPAKVPSQAHLDLFDAGIITEPLLGINDFSQRWIINDNWTYTADLTPLTQNMSADARALLVFFGIDTIANITVAGHPVAWVSNQFQQYVYDVTDFVVAPVNNDTNVTVALESAYLYGLNVTARPDAEISPTGDFEYAGIRQFIRKTQSDFGWDWGPAFVPSGIFKPAYLVTLTPDRPHIADVSTDGSRADPASHPLLASGGSVLVEETSLEISKVGQTSISTPNQTAAWLVNVTLGVRSVVGSDHPTLTITIPELNVTSGPLSVDPIPVSTNATTFLSAAFTIPDGVPARWFPHNLGTPQLYNFTIALALSNSSSPGSSVSFTTRSGFRTVQLVQTPYDAADAAARGITPGDQWHFEVNGRAFYTLGTNIIPFDPFYARMTSAQVRWVLESAVKSGQNMLRVWGGGIYQPSDELTGGYDFYAACDELGIFAWSELIFSDALYPINDWLLASVAPEVRQNVRRINRHPSNAQWAGGNEIEGIVITVNQTLANGTHYLDEFQTLFGEFIHDIVTDEESSVAYTDCSTTSGVLSLDPYEIRYANKTEGSIYGNGERYNYDASQAFNYSTYPRSRFMNEFGFHSQPSFYSWEEVLESPDDFSFNSTVVASRDHHPPAGSLAFPNPNAPQGQAQMTTAVELWLPTPNTTDTNQTFAQWCWSTQVFQSLNMVSEIAFYRRGAGEGENNLGALVWQLNDIWQGASWSSIEHSGRWKVLQYGMADIFRPVVIYPFWTPDNATLEIVVTSDRWEDVQGAAALTWYDWSGNFIDSSTLPFTVPSLNNTLILAIQELDNIVPTNHNATDVWLYLNITAQVENRTVTHEQYFTPVSLATANLVDPKINVTTGANLTFTLSAQGGVAPFTWLDHPAGTVGFFADSETGLPSNGFFLVPGIDRTVQFIPNPELSTVVDPDPADFMVRSLWNNTHL